MLVKVNSPEKDAISNLFNGKSINVKDAGENYEVIDEENKGVIIEKKYCDAASIVLHYKDEKGKEGIRLAPIVAAVAIEDGISLVPEFYAWSPKEDIKVDELAILLPIVLNSGNVIKKQVIDLYGEKLLRHFTKVKGNSAVTMKNKS